MPGAGGLPARARAHVRAAFGLHTDRHRRAAHHSGAGFGPDPRGAALHHQSGHPETAPGDPCRQPRPAARRERRPSGPPDHHGPVRTPAPHRARRRFGPPDHARASLAQRTGGTGWAARAQGRRRMAARAGADPRRPGCAVSEKAERVTAPAGPPSPAGPPRPPSQPSPPSPPSPVGLPRDSPAQRARRQRRPTGAPPPLPHPISISTTAWLLFAVLIVTAAFLFSERTPWLRLGDQASTWFLRLIADVRTPWLTDFARAIQSAGAVWASVTAVGLSVVVLTMIFRRWRHLLVFFGSYFFLVIVSQWIYSGLSRPRPYGITIIGSWAGYSAPSIPVLQLP